MGGHDYAGCYRAGCILCDVYQTGYADGKAKIHFEVQSWTLGAHATDCGCDVCVTVRLVLQRAWPLVPAD